MEVLILNHCDYNLICNWRSNKFASDNEINILSFYYLNAIFIWKNINIIAVQVETNWEVKIKICEVDLKLFKT